MSGSFLLSVRVACMLVLSACMLVLLCMCKYIYSFRLVLFEPQATQWTRASSTLRGGWCLCIDGLLLRRLAWLPLKNCVCRIVCVELCVANCAWRIVRVELCVANCACRICARFMYAYSSVGLALAQHTRGAPAHRLLSCTYRRILAPGPRPISIRGLLKHAAGAALPQAGRTSPFIDQHELLAARCCACAACPLPGH